MLVELFTYLHFMLSSDSSQLIGRHDVRFGITSNAVSHRNSIVVAGGARQLSLLTWLWTLHKANSGRRMAAHVEIVLMVSIFTDQLRLLSDYRVTPLYISSLCWSCCLIFIPSLQPPQNLWLLRLRCNTVCYTSITCMTILTSHCLVTVRLGKSGLKVSRIILGCMSYGTPEWQPWVLDEKAGLEHIKAAYEAGINVRYLVAIHPH